MQAGELATRMLRAPMGLVLASDARLSFTSDVSGKLFHYSHRVTYAECTIGDHVYYSRYLDLLEAARNEFFRSLGMSFQSLCEQDTAFPVIECQLKYRFPARYDDLLNAAIWLSACGGARVDFEYRVVNQFSKLILEGRTFHVCTTTREKPKRLPRELIDRLRPFVSAKGSKD